MNPTLSVIPFITKLSSRIIRVLGCNPGPMTLQGTNTYLIGNGQKRILIDTGDANINDYTKNLEELLKTEKILIDKIIITHWHHDHIGGVKDVLSLIKNDCSVWKYPRLDEPDVYDTIPKSTKLNLLKNGQEFSIDGATLKVIYNPGHTTDHIVLLLKEENALFSGDSILGESFAVFEDLHDYMKSLKDILNLKPDIIYPAHGKVLDDPLPQIQQYIDHRNNREKQILDVLQKNPNQCFTEMDIVKIIYIDTPKELYLAASFNVNHHLKKLVKDNLVVEIVNNEGSNAWEIKDKQSML